MTEKPRINPYLLLLIGILSVSTAAILIRLAQREAGSVSIAAWRLVFASGLAWFAVLLGKKEIKLPQKRGSLALLGLAGLALAVHFASWISSLEYSSITTSTVLVNTQPLWVAMLSPLMLRERVPKAFYLGLFIAFLGGTILAMGGSCAFQSGRISCDFGGVLAGKDPRLGIALAILGALMGAVYFLIGRKVGAGMDTFVYTAIVYSLSAFALLAFALALRQPLWRFSISTWTLLFGMAVIPQTLGHSVLNHALKFLPAMLVSLALLAEPVGTSLLAVALLKEIPAPSEVIGGVLILFGVIYAVWPRKRANGA